MVYAADVLRKSRLLWAKYRTPALIFGTPVAFSVVASIGYNYLYRRPGESATAITTESGGGAQDSAVAASKSAGEFGRLSDWAPPPGPWKG